MRILALDIGLRRTGVAFCDETNGIPFPLDTLQHSSLEEFAELVGRLVSERSIGTILIGLPLLPSGAEGEQSTSVRQYAAALESLGVEVEFLDERYTTPHSTLGDGDALAASSILTVYLDRKHS